MAAFLPQQSGGARPNGSLPALGDTLGPAGPRPGMAAMHGAGRQPQRCGHSAGGRPSAREQGKDFPEDPLAADELGERPPRQGLVAAALLVLADGAARCQVSHDPGGPSLGDAQGGRYVMRSHPRVMHEKDQHSVMVTQEAPTAHPRMLSISGKKLPVLDYEYKAAGPRSHGP